MAVTPGVHDLIPTPGRASDPRLAALAIPELDACVHCGFCLQACPTYRVTQLEPESPRGRIHLVAAAAEGRVQPNERFAAHLHLCLMCRACETACPSGVQFGRIAEHARELLGPPGSPWARRLLRLGLLRLLPYPRRLRVAARLLHLAQRSGLFRLVASILPRRAREMAGLLPPVSARAFVPGHTFPAEGERRARVALLSGCVMSVMFPDVQDAAVRVLARSGCEVFTPPDQICCGALNSHNGEAASARAMARRNIDAFLAASPDAIVVTAAGCGAAMKGYGHLLKDDPAYATRAARVAALTRDATEVLAEMSRPAAPPSGSLRVTYQDPCHLAHGQKVRAQPRALLRSIGADLVEMEGSDRCCGSAGIYNLTHPEMSQTLLAEKMDAIRRTGAAVVVAPNPGCMLQLRYGAARHRVDVRVVHLIDLLDEAYGRA
ncbi:MAG: (Fe-S)-binding protein [bacterium]